MSTFTQPFDDKNTPHLLPASGFKDFSLFCLDGYFYDAAQPEAWAQIADEAGDNIRPGQLARIVARKIEPLGVTLDKTLLWKVIHTFKIHGPALPPETVEERDAIRMRQRAGVTV